MRRFCIGLAGDAWTTIVTLRSSDPQGIDGILISEL